MISFHTDYILGESIYSYICRIHYLSATNGWKRTNELIFGKSHIKTNSILPARISMVSEATKNDSEHLLKEATGYNLCCLALPPEQKMKLKNNMKYGNGTVVASISKLASSRMSSWADHKFCKICLEEDENIIGMGLWRTEHQFQGYVVCPKHLCALTFTDSKSINRRLRLPSLELGESVKCTDLDGAATLSRYISKLWAYLKSAKPHQPLPLLYRSHLKKLRFMTDTNRLKSGQLQKVMQEKWGWLNDSLHTTNSKSLHDFSYLPKIIHHSSGEHYLKHALLMATLTKSPQDFFETALYENKKTSPVKVIKTLNNEQVIIDDLSAGTSLTKTSLKHSKSIGYLKQLARRHGIKVNERPSKINGTLKRNIWRKAFYGISSEEIAKDQNISKSTVESIIQGHAGLSAWRRHLKMVRKKLDYRRKITEYIANNPCSTRSDIQDNTPYYLWLFKNDKHWLQSHLPAALPRGYFRNTT